MGKRKHQPRQEDLWIATQDLVQTPAHAFYDQLNAVLTAARFDERVEYLCRRFYHGPHGRPSLPPGVYFRCLFIGFFEGLDSERGIAWRIADSLSLRRFLGYGLDQSTPDHSTLSRTRRLFWLSTHQAVFRWVLVRLKAAGLVTGKTIGIDATTLEANAALRTIVRRDTGAGYWDYLKGLAAEAGLEHPTREQLARLDRTRVKKGSNREWRHPHDPDARITKMKDGRTHLAHKAEHAVDLASGALVAVTLQPADAGDTTTVATTLDATRTNLGAVQAGRVVEGVLDKGYHSDGTLGVLARRQVRGYVAEPQRLRRRWKARGRAGRRAQRRVYANRRRLRGARNKRLQAKRAELCERSNAHLYETGGMRRVHLRGRENILKRLVVHAAGFNLALLMRRCYGVGTPRSLQGCRGLLDRIVRRIDASRNGLRRATAGLRRHWRALQLKQPAVVHSPQVAILNHPSTTGC